MIEYVCIYYFLYLLAVFAFVFTLLLYCMLVCFPRVGVAVAVVVSTLRDFSNIYLHSWLWRASNLIKSEEKMYNTLQTQFM